MSAISSELPWEKTGNGLHAKKAPIENFFTKLHAGAQSIAMRKMQDVDLIGATFAESKCYFEPRVVVFISHSRPTRAAEIFGIYVPTVAYDGMPDFCLRKARWHLQSDEDNSIQVESKKKYVEGGQHIDAVSLFLSAADCTEIHQLVLQLNSMVEQGLAAEHMRRPEHSWFGLNVKVSTDLLSLDISYMPFIARMQSLESWITQWRTAFLNLDPTKGILPDGEFTISRSTSLEEEMRSFID